MAFLLHCRFIDESDADQCTFEFAERLKSSNFFLGGLLGITISVDRVPGVQGDLKYRGLVA